MFVRRALLVETPVEQGVGETGAQHSFIPAAHQIQMLDPAVTHGHEARQEPLPVGTVDHEVSLMRLQRRDDDLGRQFEVIRRERPHERRRVFAVEHDLVQQVRVFPQDAGFGKSRQTRRSLGLDPAPSLLRIRHDMQLVQHRLVGPRVGDLTPGVRGEGAVSARDATAGQVAEREWNNLAPQQADQPLQRAGILQIHFAPAHGLAERERQDQVGQPLADRHGSLAAGDRAPDQEVLAALIDPAAAIGQLDTDLARESEAGLGRLSVGVESDLDRRALDILLAIRLAHGQVGAEHGQAAGRRQDAQVAVGQMQLVEQDGQSALEFLHRGRNEAGRDLLTADFQQERPALVVGRHALSPSFFSRGNPSSSRLLT